MSAMSDASTPLASPHSWYRRFVTFAIVRLRGIVRPSNCGQACRIVVYDCPVSCQPKDHHWCSKRP
ncbi:hypothetical protein J6590_044881 [Homalodisca vitripennis]|nr:hypothetical protein J6590_044881 [Homalodisca vitripennis]